MATTYIPKPLDFQQGSEADQCPVCYKSFLLVDLPVHIDFCLADSDPTMARCPICGEKTPRAVLSDHAETCASSAPFAPTVDIMCPVCHEQYPVELIEEHVGICMGDDEEEDGRNAREEAFADEDSDAADDRMVDALSIRLATTFPTHAAASTAPVTDMMAGDSSENKYDPTVLTSLSSSPLPMPTVAAVTSCLTRSTRKRKALITASSSSSVPAPVPAATFVAPAPVLSAKAQGKRPRLEPPPAPSSGTCPICHKRYRTSTHVPACQAKFARTQPKLSKEDSLLTQLELDELLAIELTRPLMASAASGDQILTPANLAALTHVHNCAKRDSHAARAQLLDRFRDILDLKAVANSRSHTPIHHSTIPNIPSLPVGMDAMALYKATTEWIRNRAPIIVHVQLDVLLKHMAVDTHYRNYFEVAEKGDIKDQSYGSGRKTWETRMFGGAYDRVPNVER
ncbi:hypothetical protein BC938DRAFT_472458 [Jimgerdemannia flammicorona]|uniref:UBZ4-type domain-containing protein n=1 Tax=Jimgerdemannia flammicorona TaxID=994334 RepID=A0A433Q624_9FUNG|nr:hypothetical protein BC938DRAFT_472458 [Jimgerdemannia flammicorona]